jgi:hypothetical protein
LFQKIPFHRQLADLGVKILDATGINLRLRGIASSLKNVRRPFEKRLLPLMNHCRVNAKPARQFGNRLLDLQGLKRNPRLEIGPVLLPFRHR